MSVADSIDYLEEDDSVPTHNELQIVDTLFKKEKSTMDKIFGEVKSVILVAILFIIFSIPAVDSLIKRFIPITENSWIILISLKAIAVMIIFYCVNNLYLARKKK